MNIKKWPSHEQIGTVDGNAIKKYPSHEQIGTVEGDAIKKYPSHEQIGTVEGDTIKKYPSHEQIGTVDGGTNVQKGAAAFVLLGMLTPEKKVTNSSSGEKPGCLGIVLGFFGFIFLKLPIGGKICAIAGAVLPIIGAIVGDNSNYVIGAPFGFLIGGGIGALGNFIIPKLSKTGKFGTLIGAVVLIIIFEILLFTSNVSTAFEYIVSFAIFGLIIGSILGAIIGSIVGLIQNKAEKK
jgi:hypothetical protein